MCRDHSILPPPPLIDCVKPVPISTTECERGSNAINNVMTSLRSRLVRRITCFETLRATLENTYLRVIREGASIRERFKNKKSKDYRIGRPGEESCMYVCVFMALITPLVLCARSQDLVMSCQCVGYIKL